MAERSTPASLPGDSPISRHSPTSTRSDVYSRITAEISAAIEAGVGPCRMPWHHDRRSGQPARQCPLHQAVPRRKRALVWAAAQAKGYTSGLWGTYRQWQAKGAQVRKGEPASLAVLWKDLRRDGASGDGRCRMEAEEGARFATVRRFGGGLRTARRGV
ncbi:ArdC family protein [Phenylobacterium sp.]|uniref:ArdC family protein n=1 Tax=Phenylobacterium sp. TaxID=1871053 RepID=UPI00391A2581